MAVDPAVLAAIEAAVAADPANTALRLHLAGLLVDNGRAADGLEQARVVLASHPAWTEALQVAHRAAHDAGEAEVALGYRRLLGALGSGVPPLPSDPVPVRAEPADVGQPIDDPELTLSLLDGDPDIEAPRVTLADVGGMEDVKQRLELAFLGPARHPSLRRAFGKSLRGGLLLYGPPGCGKTFIARALAGELGASFFAVGIADVLDMWIGSSERNLHETFERARRAAPCVLFLDELDALGQRRTNLRNSPAMRATVNQLLLELDGAEQDNDGVFLLAASNQPWDVDPALRRPGRLDRTILVLPPDQPARHAILAANLRNRPVREGIDLGALAAATEHYSGADLRAICESAAETALAASVTDGVLRPITVGDLDRARREVKPSTGPWFEAAQNVATFANASGEYDELLTYLRSRKRR